MFNLCGLKNNKGPFLSVWSVPACPVQNCTTHQLMDTDPLRAFHFAPPMGALLMSRRQQSGKWNWVSEAGERVNNKSYSPAVRRIKAPAFMVLFLSTAPQKAAGMSWGGEVARLAEPPPPACCCIVSFSCIKSSWQSSAGPRCCAVRADDPLTPAVNSCQVHRMSNKSRYKLPKHWDNGSFLPRKGLLRSAFEG